MVGRINGNMSPSPVKFGVGAQNIRVDATGSSATLGRQLSAAFSLLGRDFQAYITQVEHFLPEDMLAALEPTFELSQVYVPVMTGELKASGYLEMESFRGGARVEMGYGRGGVPDYAVVVHEMPMRHAEPTRDKYLEAAVDEDYYHIIQRVTDRVRARMGFG